MPSILMTGAGGFIGRHILANTLKRKDCNLYLLEQGNFMPKLQKYMAEHNAESGSIARAKIIPGDITQPNLGLPEDTRRELQENVTHVIHLAALYNLAAPKDISYHVNVQGTRNVLDFLEGCRSLKRFGYMSTVAISGTFTGLYTEEDFDKCQAFKNYYEETKYLAEKAVRERWDRIPTVIGRPTIVVGHSKTGAIDKVDGPYYAMTMIARNLHLMGVNSGTVKCHIAPVDYVADAFCALMDAPNASGVYCLGDPNPLTYMELLDLVCERWGKIKTVVWAPPMLLKPMMRIGLLQRLFGVPYQAFQYTLQSIEYSTVRAREALAPFNIVCPPVSAYIDVMIDYFRKHLDDREIRRGNWKQATGIK